VTRDEADNGDAAELEIRPVTITVDSSSDTSLDRVDTSTTVYNPPCNEILYLQVLLNGKTLVVRKPGILPVICYVDSGTSTSNDKEVPAATTKEEIVETLEELMKRLNTEGEFPLHGLSVSRDSNEILDREKREPRIRGNNTDDFFMEG
jgi:hypothetical protein